MRGEPVILDLVRLSESLTRPIVVLSGSTLILYPSVLAPTDRAIKRVADIVSSSLLIVLASVPMLVTALAILVLEGRPIVYSEQRAGLYGHPSGFASSARCASGPTLNARRCGMRTPRRGPRSSWSEIRA